MRGSMYFPSSFTYTCKVKRYNNFEIFWLKMKMRCFSVLYNECTLSNESKIKIKVIFNFI